MTKRRNRQICLFVLRLLIKVASRIKWQITAFE
jgi:hypothetical protein